VTGSVSDDHHMTIDSSHPEPRTDSRLDGERRDLLAALAERRAFLVQTIVGVSDADAGRRTTVSELCLGGLVKHVTDTEATWADFIVRGAAAFPSWDDPATFEARAASFVMAPGETVESVLVAYGEVARRTDELVATLPSLDASHSTPDAPWAPSVEWSARRVLVHLLGETAQHAGHADILREAIDGAKTMG
jgi:hypothetical protein